MRAQRRRWSSASCHGTTRMRTHVEVDPKDRTARLRRRRKARVETMHGRSISNSACCRRRASPTIPAPTKLMVEALRAAQQSIGAAPYYDTDPPARSDRIFEMAREFDVDIDMHLDRGDSTDGMQIEYVCRNDREI